MKIIGSFIKPEHLDIDPKRLSQPRVERAITELQKMNKFKTPRDKMVLIMNSWKIIGLMLKETNISNAAEGADMFFPSIIYILLKGCPKDLKAHLEFIKLYRNPELLESEDDYFLTTMSSALDFIGNMIGDDLNIEKSEYKDLYDKFAEEKGGEIDQRANIRKEKKLEKNYDEFENQSEVSCITTQSSAQLLGELEKMDVPIIANTLVLNKGIQTDEPLEEAKEVKESTNKSLISASTASGAPSNQLWLSRIENKVVAQNETFWAKTLVEDFDNLKIGDLKEMHRIMLSMKDIISSKSKLESEEIPPKEDWNEKPKENEELFEIFGGPEKQEPKDELPKDTLNNGLDGLDDIFS